MLRQITIVVLSLALLFWVWGVREYSSQPLTTPGLSTPGLSTLGAADPASAVEGVSSTQAAITTPRFSSNNDCRDCHLEIFEEWLSDQHAQAWFNEPLLPQDPKRTECNNCHAPLPVLETGVLELPKIRGDRFEEGVGCIECHWNVDHVEGPRPASDAACAPRFNPLFSKSEICASCHAPHGTLDEWRETHWAQQGDQCQECHMPWVDAPSVTGGPPRRRRSHAMRSQRDPEMLREAVRMEVSLSQQVLQVELENHGAAHNVPGEIFNREMFLMTVWRDAEGEEVGRHRESFKTVRREQRATNVSTQLRPGEVRSFEYPAPFGAVRAQVRLGYKYLLYLPDSTAVSVWEKEVTL